MKTHDYSCCLGTGEDPVGIQGAVSIARQQTLGHGTGIPGVLRHISITGGPVDNGDAALAIHICVLAVDRDRGKACSCVYWKD